MSSHQEESGNSSISDNEYESDCSFLSAQASSLKKNQTEEEKYDDLSIALSSSSGTIISKVDVSSSCEISETDSTTDLSSSDREVRFKLSFSFVEIGKFYQEIENFVFNNFFQTSEYDKRN